MSGKHWRSLNLHSLWWRHSRNLSFNSFETFSIADVVYKVFLFSTSTRSKKCAAYSELLKYQVTIYLGKKILTCLPKNKFKSERFYRDHNLLFNDKNVILRTVSSSNPPSCLLHTTPGLYKRRKSAEERVSTLPVALIKCIFTLHNWCDFIFYRVYSRVSIWSLAETSENVRVETKTKSWCCWSMVWYDDKGIGRCITKGCWLCSGFILKWNSWWYVAVIILLKKYNNVKRLLLRRYWQLVWTKWTSSFQICKVSHWQTQLENHIFKWEHIGYRSITLHLFQLLYMCDLISRLFSNKLQ